MPLSEVLFQDDAQSRLQRALKSGRMPHAYLFAGPPGVGKEMLATRLAKVLLCGAASRSSAEIEPGLFGLSAESAPDPELFDACDTCIDCELFAAGTHPDFHRVHRMLARHHPDSSVRNRKATVLSVDVIRHFLIEPMGVRPSRGRAKVFIVAEAERLSDEAQNAMLKTLEEPPSHSYLILLAQSADSLLATTRSRCQMLTLGTLPGEFVYDEVIRRVSLDAAQARFLSALSEGSLGQALRFAELGIHDCVDSVISAVKKSRVEPLSASKSLQELAKELANRLKRNTDDDDGDTNNTRDAQSIIFAMIATVMRDVLRLRVNAPQVSFLDTTSIQALAAGGDTQSAREGIRATNLAEYHVSRNANTGLIFDELALALSR